MFTFFTNPNRHFSMPRVLLPEIERKVLRFLTSITWTKLGMFWRIIWYTIILARFTTFQCFSVLSIQEVWIDIRRGTLATTTHVSYQSHQLEGCVRFFRHDVGTTHSEILSEVGHCRRRCNCAPANCWYSKQIASCTTTFAQECFC